MVFNYYFQTVAAMLLSSWDCFHPVAKEGYASFWA